MIRACLVLGVLCAGAASAASAQPLLVDALQRHGVALPDRGVEGAFDERLSPAVPLGPGSLAAPLALLSTGTRAERVNAAYAFGILAGRSARGVVPAERDAAVRIFVEMIGGDDRRARIAGARVAGRVLAVPLDAEPVPAAPAGLLDALFGLLNQSNETEQLAAMDALGQLRPAQAVRSLTERYHFYRDAGRRALAGGALEALARIGDPSSVAIAKVVAADRWAEGRDPTALAVDFARERLLKDGSVARIRLALDDRSRRVQARAYLIEFGAPEP
jgi:hypothetical protein